MIFYPRVFVSLNLVLYDYGTSSGTRSVDTFYVVPKHASVNINSYIEADTASFSIRYEDLPIDPRLIKSGVAKIFMINAKGRQAITNADIKADDVSFIGFIDDVVVGLSGSNREVSFDCRDYTSLFIDTIFDDGNRPTAEGKKRRKIPLNRPMKAILQDLIGRVPGAGSIEVDDRTDGAVENFNRLSGGKYSLLNGKEQTQGNFQYVSQNQTYWDVMVSLAEQASLIIYIELDKVVLTTAKNLYSTKGKFQGTIPFFYGKNLKSIQLERNMARRKRFNLKLKSFNTKTGKVVEVNIPQHATEAWSRENKIPRKTNQIAQVDTQGVVKLNPAPGHTFKFKGKTREQLIALGEKIFLEFDRQQLTGTFTTKDMSVLRGQEEINILKIRNGSPLQIDFSSKDIEKAMIKDVDENIVSKSNRISYLVSKGLNYNTARVLYEVMASATGRIKGLFYCNNVNLTFDSEGFKLQVGFLNFITGGEIEDGQVRNG